MLTKLTISDPIIFLKLMQSHDFKLTKSALHCTHVSLADTQNDVVLYIYFLQVVHFPELHLDMIKANIPIYPPPMDTAPLKVQKVVCLNCYPK